MPPPRQALQVSLVAEEERKCSNADPFKGIKHKIPTFKDTPCENCMVSHSLLTSKREAVQKNIPLILEFLRCVV